MALIKRDKITYLKITEGKIRRKSTPEDPEAEERYVEKTKKTVHERVYTACEGYIRDIIVQTHEEYGTSYNVILLDPSTGEKYSLNMGESTRYFQSFVEHLPEIDFSRPVEFKPYSFSQDGRSSIGVSFKQDGDKVPNHYKDYDEAKNKSTAKNGLEKFDFKKVKNDKDEQKILRVKLLKFLKGELKNEVLRLKAYLEEHPEAPELEEKPEDAETPVVAEEEEEQQEEASRGKKKGAAPATKKKETKKRPY